LLEAKQSLRFSTPKPQKLAYKLREAIAASKKFQDLKHYYDALFHSYTFRIERDAVIAEYNNDPVGTPVGENPNVLNGSHQKAQKGTIDSATSLFDVLAGALEGAKQEYVELFFPNVILKPEDKLKLHQWTLTNDWGYLDHEEKGVTLTTKEEHKELIWIPEND
jgi:hypothetical protein